MKKLLTILTGVVLAASLATSAYAQAAGPTGGGVQGNKEQGQRQKGKGHAPLAGKMLKELNLTPDQQKQVKDLMEKFKAKREEMMKSGTKPNRKDAMAMRKEFMDSIAKILTPAQQAKLKELQDKAKDRIKDKVKGGGVGTTGGNKTGGTTGGGGGL
jgi:Spy/CpxP family protein refolding chaperone